MSSFLTGGDRPPSFLSQIEYSCSAASTLSGYHKTSRKSYDQAADASFSNTEDSDLLTALLGDRVDTVKEHLERGLSLEDFLTKENLLRLYNSPLTKARCRPLQLIAEEKGQISLRNVVSLIKELSGNVFEPKYCIESCKHAFRDLFIWSVLTQHQKMAMVFWGRAKENLSLAVLAQILSKNLHDKDPDPESNHDLQRQMDFYKDLAVSFLSKCRSSDASYSYVLLLKEIPAFGNTTVLKMASRVVKKNFIDHSAFRDLNTELWFGKLSNENQFKKLLFATIFFVFAPFVLKYRETNEQQTSERSTVDGTSANENYDTEAMTTVNSRPTDHPCLPSKCVSVYFQKLKSFFQAPVIKFYYNTLSYFIFLLLFGTVLLTDFHPTTSIKEWIIIACVFTSIAEEIRQIAVEDAGEIRRKLYNYIADVWNFMDVITLATFVIGMSLRFIPVTICGQCFYAARIIFAINFMGFCFRLLHMFSVNRTLGPKLVMIGKMMIDLMSFMVILLVFVAAYGIASHAILYPNQPLNIQLFRDVLSRPWWNLFGELGLDEVSGADCKNETWRLHDPLQCASLEYDEFSASDCAGYKAEMCPSINWFVPIMMFIYVLVTNVLMLNLLIAMFSNTFDDVQGQADVVWIMKSFYLIVEYCGRPCLPPPLIVFSHIRCCIRHFCCQKTEFVGNAESVRLANDTLNWESEIVHKFLSERESKNRSTEDQEAKDTINSIQMIRVRYQIIGAYLEEMEEKVIKLSKEIELY